MSKKCRQYPIKINATTNEQRMITFHHHEFICNHNLLYFVIERLMNMNVKIIAIFISKLGKRTCPVKGKGIDRENCGRIGNLSLAEDERKELDNGLIKGQFV